MKTLKFFRRLLIWFFALSLFTFPATSQILNENELDFRYWRNLKTGKAFEAALVAVDESGAQGQLYLNGGKRFIIEIADYHDDDKAHVKEWIEWKKEEAIQAAKRGASGKAPQSASKKIRQALDLRVRINKKLQDPDFSGSSKEQSTTNEIIVQLKTRDGATGIPKGELHVVAFVGNHLENARLLRGKLQIVNGKDSEYVTEVSPESVATSSYKPGRAEDYKFNVATTDKSGEEIRTVSKGKKKGKSKKGGKRSIPLKFQWKHEQSIVGVRARLLIGGTLAAEVVYPLNIEAQLEK